MSNSDDSGDKILKRFHTFYIASLVDDYNRLPKDIFLYPPILNVLEKLYTHGVGAVKQSDLFSTIRNAETKSVMDYYWSLHNQQYLSRLQHLCNQLPTVIVTQHTKAVIIIAAMNEINIAKAIDAAKSAYHGDFEKEIPIIVYHNYKTKPDNGVQKAMKKLKKIKNVFIVNEKVSIDNDVAMAKKVATDIVQLHIPNIDDIPFILMDADVILFTDGVVSKALESLTSLDVLAVSPYFNYDPEIKNFFPVLGTVLTIESKIRDYLFKQGVIIPITCGIFSVLFRKVLAITGGIKVINSSVMDVPQIVLHEDVQLARDLLHVVGYDEYGFLEFWGKTPIISLKDYGCEVYVDSSREIYDILMGEFHDYRWRNDDYYQKISGTKRNIIPSKLNTIDIAELGKLTEENITKAINRHLKYIYLRSYFLPEELPVASKLLLSVLDELGLSAMLSAIHIYDTEEMHPICDSQESLHVILTTNEWKIKEFKSVKKMR